MQRARPPSRIHPFIAALLSLAVAAMACNFPLAPPPAERPAHAGLANPGDRVKRRPHTAIPEALGLKVLPPVALLPRLTPDSDWEIEFSPPGVSPRDAGRPVLSGTPQTLDTEHFRIHYTLTGTDKVPAQDTNGNGHPDYVEHVARALEYSWHAEIIIFGWPAPPEDRTLGGDGRIDVYLEELLNSEDIAGYADSGNAYSFVGDNPNTDIVETRASHAFMGLDNDYYEIGGSRIHELEFMRTVVAHELLHIIQYGIDGSEPGGWLWESTATWIEDEVYNQVNDGNRVLTAPFKAPDSCQITRGGAGRVEDSDNWYGQWLFLRYISERYGHATVRAIWELAGTLDGYTAVRKALEGVGVTLETVQRDYAIALLTRDFEEGDNYPVLRLEGSLSFGEIFVPEDGVSQMGADFIEIRAGAPITVVLEGELRGVLVGLRGHEAHLFEMPGGRVSVEASAFERLYLIVLNQNVAARERECRFIDYTVEVIDGGEPQTADGISPRAFFRPPRVEGLIDPGAD